MVSGQVISHTAEGNQVILLDERRMALGIGPVLLPLTRTSLARLSDVLVQVARDFDSYMQEDRVYINSDRLLLRLTDIQFQELLGLVSRALAWLHGNHADLPN